MNSDARMQFQCEKHRPPYAKGLRGYSLNFAGQLALSRATAFLHLAGEQLFHGPFPPRCSDAVGLAVPPGEGQSGHPPRSEVGESIISGMSYLGLVGGLDIGNAARVGGCRGGEHDRRAVPPEGECERLEGT